MSDRNNRPDTSIDNKMADIWSSTCGSWENCNVHNVQSFLSECHNENIDPQYCRDWIQQHNESIPDWSAVSEITQDWVNQHTSTGSPISVADENV
jgi:hypothetical protein